MDKKILRIVLVILVLVLIVFVTNVEASSFIGQLQNNMSGGSGSNMGKSLKNLGNSIIGVIQIVAVGIAVIMLLYIAIKYMIASPSEKADFKKTAVHFLVGAVIIFASTGILQLIKNIMTNLSGTLAK